MVFLVFEASQPSGAYYRLGMGCYLPPALVSVMIALARLI